MALPLAALIAIILIGSSLGWNKTEEPPIGVEARYSARLLKVREASTIGMIAIAEVDSVNFERVTPFKVRIHSLSEMPELYAGRELAFTSAPYPLYAPLDIPDARDLYASLRRQGVTASFELLADSVEYIRDSPGVMGLFLRANHEALTRLRQLPLSPLSVNMLSAMLLGDGEYLPQENRRMFSAAGLAHILALSGMHVGIIAMIISAMLWPLYLSRRMGLRVLLTVAALWAYAAFTGFPPSVVRAVIMASVYLAGRALQRRSVPLNSLCLAAMLILIVNPSELYSPGFQLSFAAVGGIIMFFPLINRVNRREHPLLWRAVSLPALSLSAMLPAGVVAAFHFHNFPLLFIPANIAVAVLLPLFVISGLVSMLFHVTGPTDWLSGAIERVAGFTASLPCASVGGLYPSGWLVIALLAALTLFAVSAHGRRRFLIVESAMLLAAVTAVGLMMPGRQYPPEEAYVLTDSRRRNHLIRREGNEFVLYSSAPAQADRLELHAMYSLMLEDFLALRGVDSLRLAPKGARALTVEGTDSFIVELDSCSAGRIALRRLRE